MEMAAYEFVKAQFLGKYQELITSECEAVLGNTYNLPQHDVTMTRPFCLSRFLTNARAGRAYRCIHALYISILRFQPPQQEKM